MRSAIESRRAFLRKGLLLAGGTPVALGFRDALLAAEAQPPAAGAPNTTHKQVVAIVACKGYGAELKPSLARGFDLLGGIGSLVRNKTITVKLNLTGTDFSPFLGRPVGETYMTHYETVRALASLLFGAGARRIRFVESTTSRAELADTLSLADWDIKALQSLGTIEFENTRNLGSSKSYSHLPVPGGGYMFSSFEFNRAYGDTDVVISMAKLKNHLTAGVTLAMKNLFGITPNSLYGSAAGSEEATEGRGELHSPEKKLKLPGLKPGITSIEAGWRVPRIVADICASRPVHLSIIDGITSVNGGEGPWCQEGARMRVTTPGVLIVGLNPVATDAVATAVMGYANPRAQRGTKPFEFCDNHLLLAEQAGIGTADLSQIDVRGLSVEKAKYPYS